MEATTTSETTYRAVFIHANDCGKTKCIVRDTAEHAWEDVDAAWAPGAPGEGRWTVEQTTTTTTTTEVTR